MNPVLAEAIRLAKERQKQADDEAGRSEEFDKDTRHDTDTDQHIASMKPSSPTAKRSRWLDDNNNTDHDDDHEKSSPKKQKHWSASNTHTRSTTSLSAAERAQLEVQEFKRRQAELSSLQDVNNDDHNKHNDNEAAISDDLDDLIDHATLHQDHTKYTSQPFIDTATTKVQSVIGGSNSSPEEELHIRREGHSYHALNDDNVYDDATKEKGHGTEDRGDHDDGEMHGPSLPPLPLPQQQGGNDGDGDGYYYDGDGIVEGYPEMEEEEEQEEERVHHEVIEQDVLFEKKERETREDPGKYDPNTHGNASASVNTNTAMGASPGASPPPSEMTAATTTMATTSCKRHMSMLNECRSVENYEKLNRISEGSYGVVYRARDKETGEICALKKVKLEKERDGFPLTSVREINVLLSLSHPSIVNVSEVVVGSTLDAVFMVMEYADHDLKSVMDRRMTQPFSIAEVKCLMLQLLSGIAYLHGQWVLHRDLKTSNILYTNDGRLKICDFGLARQYGSPLKPYTHMVVTLWYRAPELLLGAFIFIFIFYVCIFVCLCFMWVNRFFFTLEYMVEVDLLRVHS